MRNTAEGVFTGRLPSSERTMALQKSSRGAHQGSTAVLYRMEMTTSMHFLPNTIPGFVHGPAGSPPPVRPGNASPRPRCGEVGAAEAKGNRPSQGRSSDTGAAGLIRRAGGPRRTPPLAPGSSGPACAGCAARESSPWSRRCRACARSPCCSRRVQFRAARLLRAATGE